MFTLFFPKAYAVTTEIGDVINLDDFISKLLGNWIFPIGFALAGIMIIYAGFRMIVGTGNPESITGAKSILVSAVLGLILLYLISVFFGILTRKPDTESSPQGDEVPVPPESPPPSGDLPD